MLAKTPIAGRVKTRLCPPFEPAEAAELARGALVDTLAAVAAVAATHVVALDGVPGPWLPAGFEVVAQPSGTLDRRLAGVFSGRRGPTVLVGMDTPQVTPALLCEALDRLGRGAGAVLGPAADGGYWLVGLRRPDPRAFLGVPMSEPSTFAAQLERLAGLGLRTELVPELRDVDVADDAPAVASAAPDTEFARTLARLRRARGALVPR